MNKLKTLKDIELNSLDLGCDEEGCSLSTRLRQEAIKWCNQEEMEKRAKDFLKSVKIDKTKGVISTADFGIFLFYTFFNLTNEELFDLSEEDFK